MEKKMRELEKLKEEISTAIDALEMDKITENSDIDRAFIIVKKNINEIYYRLNQKLDAVYLEAKKELLMLKDKNWVNNSFFVKEVYIWTICIMQQRLKRLLTY